MSESFFTLGYPGAATASGLRRPAAQVPPGVIGEAVRGKRVQILESQAPGGSVLCKKQLKPRWALSAGGSGDGGGALSNIAFFREERLRSHAGAAVSLFFPPFCNYRAEQSIGEK